MKNKIDIDSPDTTGLEKYLERQKHIFALNGRRFRDTLSEIDQVRHDELMRKARLACERERLVHRMLEAA